MRMPDKCPHCGEVDCPLRVAAAYRFADASLKALMEEQAFDNVYDRGAAVGVLIMRFIDHEGIVPERFVEYLQTLATKSFIEIEVKGGMTCH